MVHGFLFEAVPTDVSDKVIRLSYHPKFSFHRNSLENRSNRPVVEKIIAEVYGEGYNFETVITGNRANINLASSPVAREEPLVKKALDLFDGEIVQIEREAKR